MTISIHDMTTEEQYCIFDTYFDGIENPEDYDTEFERWLSKVTEDEMNDDQHAIDFYLNFFNNYLTVAKIAEHHGYSLATANGLINRGRELYNKQCESK